MGLHTQFIQVFRMSVHKTFVNLEERLKQPDHKLIVRAMETCVADFGYKDYRCWTDYARYLLQHDPAALASLHEVIVALFSAYSVLFSFPNCAYSERQRIQIASLSRQTVSSLDMLSGSRFGLYESS